MRMARVAKKRDGRRRRNPCGNRVAVADLPVEAGRCFFDCCYYLRIPVRDQRFDIFHVTGLEPRLGDVGRVLVRQDPVKFLTVSQCVLN